jgi:hypothetical protein
MIQKIGRLLRNSMRLRSCRQRGLHSLLRHLLADSKNTGSQQLGCVGSDRSLSVSLPDDR